MVTGRFPTVIQGGMGVGVSGWQLARAVSLTGQLGVVSGTAVDVVLVRRLQLGDPGGHMRRALKVFPLPEMAARIVDRYFIAGGKPPNEPHCALPMLTATPSQQQLELLAVANFVEVLLAKQGHRGVVGINYLEKIQLPTLPALFGAMLAGVDYVLMGAGIPTSIPGAIDKLCRGEAVELPLRIANAEPHDTYCSRFDPRAFTQGRLARLKRPKFLPIVASSTLATMLTRKATGRVDGFIVEGPTAGGHNAPPRGKQEFNFRGEPVYGPRDAVDLEAMQSLGLPFWLAGSYGSPEQVVRALESGATGVQVGTAFAFCEESGIETQIKQQVIQRSRRGTLDVFTDHVASPAGFPFKILQLEDSLSSAHRYADRRRICDVGLLRQGYRKPDGSLGWRCPAEPMEAYAAKGGLPADTSGRKCLCNALLANIGLAQMRTQGVSEPPLVTCGDDVNQIHHFLPSQHASSYCARDVVRHLMQLVESESSQT
jgi:nitronate monooxygenase